MNLLNHLRHGLISLALLLSLSAISQAQTQTDTPEPFDKIIVLVNDGLISARDLDQEVATISLQFRQRGQSLPPDNILRKQVLDRLIAQEVQLQEAKRLNLRITDSQLNGAINNIANSNQLDLQGFQQRLQSEGYDYQQFRENLRRDLLIRQTRKRLIDDRINISDQDIDDFLDAHQEEVNRDLEHHLRHIQISVPENADAIQLAAAQGRAQQLLERLRKGEDFANLAASESDGQHALEGGDLGWRRFAQIPTVFIAALRKLQVGEVSNLIRSPAGFHILKLENLRGNQRHLVTQTHSRHILLKPSPVRDDDATRSTLEGLRQRILQGEDFAKLARAYSEDYGSAANGGDLGWYNPGSMVADFDAALDKLAPKTLSPVFQTPFGWHLAEVLERREIDDTEAFQRNQARQQLFETKAESEGELWLQRLLNEAFIQYRDPQLAH